MPRAPGLARERAQGAAAAGERPADLLAWATQALAGDGFAPAAHQRLLIQRLEAIVDGTIDRLMVLMPPGSAKSTYASVLFPAWWFVRHPASSVIAASHTADLAQHFARQLRAVIEAHAPVLGYDLAAGQRAAARWQTSTAGHYFATGIRGPLAGRRADLAIIDDPVKAMSDADSATQREHLWSWFRSDLLTRLKPRGRIVLIMTRWHQDDLAGRLLGRGIAEWNVLRLPALAEADDPLGRQPGRALWPEWEDEAALLRKRDTMGERVWSALFQQSPRPPHGSLFKVTRIELTDAPSPLAGTIVRAWDLAATAADGRNDPDYTVGLKLLRDPAGRLFVLDVVRLRASPHGVETAMLATAAADGRAVRIALAEDPGQAGKAQVLHYARKLAGYIVTSSRETGSKQTRALPIASQVEAGNLLLVRAAWNQDFMDELRDFPFGRKDDQVDALARAFTVAVEVPDPSRRLAVTLMAR